MKVKCKIYPRCLAPPTQFMISELQYFWITITLLETKTFQNICFLLVRSNSERIVFFRLILLFFSNQHARFGGTTFLGGNLQTLI